LPYGPAIGEADERDDGEHIAPQTIPASHPACVLVSDQASMNCGSSAGTIENPARPRISAPQIAVTIRTEGPGAELVKY
jgi:hypothetical protein